MQKVLGKYYSKKGDCHPQAAGITHHRAEALRAEGFEGEKIGQLEIALLHVSTANTIPTHFWYFSHVISRPELVERLRNDVRDVPEYGIDGTATVNMDTLVERCPLLLSCYREAVRLSNKAQGNRKVMEDTTIPDGKGGSYLLKKGWNIQMPSEPLHLSDSIWGPDAAEFNPERFLEGNAETNEMAKTRKASYIPFGGGIHLCPGRNFALAENVGFMLSFLLTFDVSPTDESGKWALPAMDQVAIVGAACKPVNDGEGFGIKIKRRAGWENTKWKFTSGKQTKA